MFAAPRFPGHSCLFCTSEQNRERTVSRLPQVGHSRDLKRPLSSSAFWVPALLSLRAGGGGRQVQEREQEHRLPEISKPKQNIRTNGTELPKHRGPRKREKGEWARCLRADPECGAAPKLRARARGPREQDGRRMQGGGPGHGSSPEASASWPQGQPPSRTLPRPPGHCVGVGQELAEGYFERLEAILMANRVC